MRITEKDAARQEAILRIKNCKESGDTSLVLSDLASLDELPPEVFGLTQLESLDVSGTDLKTLPRAIGCLKNLRNLDVSYTRVSKIPASITKCRHLSVNRRFFTLTRLVSGLVGAILRLPLFGNMVRDFQVNLYWKFCSALDRMQQELDVCGWHKENGKPVCRRFWRQCCRYDYVCDYLTDEGCTVESLCCKLWLCGPALTHLKTLAADSPLREKARRYLKARTRYEAICRLLCIPLKGRASLGDAFNKDYTPLDGINTYTERWYDDTLLGPWGLFISSSLSGFGSLHGR